jgi:hypothetical protein
MLRQIRPKHQNPDYEVLFNGVAVRFLLSSAWVAGPPPICLSCSSRRASVFAALCPRSACVVAMDCSVFGSSHPEKRRHKKPSIRLDRRRGLVSGFREEGPSAARLRPATRQRQHWAWPRVAREWRGQVSTGAAKNRAGNGANQGGGLTSHREGATLWRMVPWWRAYGREVAEPKPTSPQGSPCL